MSVKFVGHVGRVQTTLEYLKERGVKTVFRICDLATGDAFYLLDEPRFRVSEAKGGVHIKNIPIEEVHPWYLDTVLRQYELYGIPELIEICE